MPERERLPDVRPSRTAKRTVCGHELYIIVGFHPETRRPSEVFVTVAKHGSVLGGLMDTVAVLLSVGLQYGIPWEVLRSKLEGTRFGDSTDEHSSLSDGLARTVEELCR